MWDFFYSDINLEVEKIRSDDNHINHSRIFQWNLLFFVQFILVLNIDLGKRFVFAKYLLIIVPNSKFLFKKSNFFYFDMPILLCHYLIDFVSKFRIDSPCTNFSISYLGTILILRPLILFVPIHPLSVLIQY